MVHVFAEEISELVDEHHILDDATVETCDSADAGAPLPQHNLPVVDPCFSSFYRD